MRKFFILALVIFILAAIAGVLDLMRTRAGHDVASRDLSYETTTMMIGDTRITLEIAETPAQKSRGLGGREGLAENAGMLFVFEEDGLHGFWMKDMRFAIDIAWFDADFCVVDIAQRVSPGTYPAVFVPDTPARYVIEMEAGFFGSHGIEKGDCFETPVL